jgi:hypothetical protein
VRIQNLKPIFHISNNKHSCGPVDKIMTKIDHINEGGFMYIRESLHIYVTDEQKCDKNNCLFDLLLTLVFICTTKRKSLPSRQDPSLDSAHGTTTMYISGPATTASHTAGQSYKIHTYLQNSSCWFKSKLQGNRKVTQPIPDTKSKLHWTQKKKSNIKCWKCPPRSVMHAFTLFLMFEAARWRVPVSWKQFTSWGLLIFLAQENREMYP